MLQTKTSFSQSIRRNTINSRYIIKSNRSPLLSIIRRHQMRHRHHFIRQRRKSPQTTPKTAHPRQINIVQHRFSFHLLQQIQTQRRYFHPARIWVIVQPFQQLLYYFLLLFLRNLKSINKPQQYNGLSQIRGLNTFDSACRIKNSCFVDNHINVDFVFLSQQ